MYNSENKKKLENNGEFLVLHKETMVNYFFISVLVISFALFVLFFWLLIFNAVLLGYFTKRTLTPTENTVKTIEDKSEKK